MLNIYRNSIFEYLQNHKLGIDNFSFDGDHEFCISYAHQEQKFDYYFVSAEDSFDWFLSAGTSFAPGFKVIDRITEYERFHIVLNDFAKWLIDHVERYAESKRVPDLWSEYIKREHLIPIKAEDYYDSDFFTKEDKQTLNLSINELKLLIVQKFELNEAHQNLVEDRLNYLSDSLERSTNKTDWKGILINTMISISIALSLDTQKGQELYNLFIAVMQVMPGLNN
jgi:hypothetical protein